MEPMTGGPRGKAWPTPIGPSDVAERCLALVVLIRCQAVRSERRGREREKEERPVGGGHRRRRRRRERERRKIAREEREVE